MMDISAVQTKVRDFIVSNFYMPEESVLENESSLVDQGIIDSTGVLEVVGFLEEEFGIAIQDREMVPDNLDSVSRIVAFVDRKRSDG